MQHDTFKNLAQHYDAMMDHIDYERWVVVTTMIAELCPDEGFKHLDVACGTGSLLRELTNHRWQTTGIDLSYAMLQQARKSSEEIAVAQADMCQLPFHNSFALATCFFDSLNFLTEDDAMPQALTSIHDSLNDTGVFFFDVITERMVTEHFADQDWIDHNGGHRTRWSGKYDAASRIVTNTIHIEKGDSTAVQERVYSQDEIEIALKAAGFTLLGVLDTETWREPDVNSLRLDFVATRNPDDIIHLKFESIQADIQALLAE